MDESYLAKTIIAAIAYVTLLHDELTGENGAPALGVQNQVVEAILADPALTAYVRDWAKRNYSGEATTAPPSRPPIDAVYERVRALLVAARDKSPVFG